MCHLLMSEIHLPTSPRLGNHIPSSHQPLTCFNQALQEIMESKWRGKRPSWMGMPFVSLLTWHRERELRGLKLTSSSLFVQWKAGRDSGATWAVWERTAGCERLEREPPAHRKTDLGRQSFPQLVQKIKEGGMNAIGLWVTDTFLNFTLPLTETTTQDADSGWSRRTPGVRQPCQDMTHRFSQIL